MSWLLRSDSLPSSLKSLKQYILEQKGGVLTVGKFRGRYFNEVLAQDPAYCVWVSQLRDPTRCFREFQAYLATVGILNPEPPPPDDDESEGEESSDAEYDVGWLHPPPGLPMLYEEPPPKVARGSDTERMRSELLKNPEEKIELRPCVVCLELPAKVIFRRWVIR